MSKSNTLEADLLKLYFQAVAAANIADNAAAAPAVSIFVSLHTADPTETGSLANEAAYTGYARMAIARDATGWDFTQPAGVSTISPHANIEFPVCTAVPGANLTHFGVSRTVGGICDYSGTLTPNVAMAVGVVPRVTTSSTITED
jgi:hypothetical protein